MQVALQLTNQNGYDRLEIIGPISEDTESHLNNLVSKIPGNLLVDFKGVSSVNSLGVRAWVNFMRQLGTDRSIAFENCTPDIVSQMVMIPNFRGHAKVQSVFGPFQCESCGETQQELFVVGKNMPDASNGFDVGEVKCRACGSTEIEFEEVEESYFSFAA
jgi:anti-anti-sigma regulatory factor